jgi:phosphotransferase system enzyme I (PtsI)
MSLVLRGVAASPGYAIGKACLMRRGEVEMPRLVVLDADQIPHELERFRMALRQAQESLLRTRERLDASSVSHFVRITDAHLGLLRDSDLIARVCKRIEESRLNAEWALTKSLNEVRTELASSDDAYVRERVSDLDLVSGRIIAYLSGFLPDGIAELRHRPIVVARDLSETDASKLSNRVLQAFAVDRGGRTCRAAVVARSLGIPAVVGLERITDAVQTGDLLILDGIRGEVLVNPSAEVLEDYTNRHTEYLLGDEALMERAQRPARTVDECRVPVRANLDTPEALGLALKRGADGVGLFRTEFLFVNRDRPPGEEEHYTAYRDVAERCRPNPVIVRTVDLGAEQVLGRSVGGPPYSRALGLRGIRYALKQSHVLKDQFKGILRAACHGDVRALLPMVSTVEEVRKAKEILLQAEEELKEAGERYEPEVSLGVMIEVPAAVSIADMIAQQVDFLAIGTNDLIQYVMAADRADEEVAYLYQPLHPAVIRMIDAVIVAAHGMGKRVILCGEMAGELANTPILLGLGVDELSTNPLAVPRVKDAICSTRMYETRALAGEILELTTASEVQQFARERLRVRPEPEPPAPEGVAPPAHI